MTILGRLREESESEVVGNSLEGTASSGDSANSRHFRPAEVYSTGSIHGREGRQAG